MNQIAKENFENNLDHILLENSSNPKTYWKIMGLSLFRIVIILSGYIPVLFLGNTL
jgi:hypothetical protein